MSAALDRLFEEAGRTVAATPALARFVDWPAGPKQGDRTVQSLRVTNEAATLHGTPLLDAIAAAAHDMHWQQTYSEAEVGRAYLDAYGWVELLGPGGHFHAEDLRAFIGLWGPGLHYPTHAHPASEVYLVLRGSARFTVDGRDPHDAAPGETVHIPGGTRHEMRMGSAGIVVFALWKGAGLAQNARLTAP